MNKKCHKTTNSLSVALPYRYNSKCNGIRSSLSVALPYRGRSDVSKVLQKENSSFVDTFF